MPAIISLMRSIAESTSVTRIGHGRQQHLIAHTAQRVFRGMGDAFEARHTKEAAGALEAFVGFSQEFRQQVVHYAPPALREARVPDLRKAPRADTKGSPQTLPARGEQRVKAATPRGQRPAKFISSGGTVSAVGDSNNERRIRLARAISTVNTAWMPREAWPSSPLCNACHASDSSPR